jgi:hypothetical protein
MPSYKAHRTRGVGTGADSRVVDVLRECNVPVGEPEIANTFVLNSTFHNALFGIVLMLFFGG